ncbi:MAG: PIG-L family deacetylase [Phycisphaerae bacterium]
MKVLAIGAHPDDIEFQCAGTLAKYKRLGHTVAMAVATNGEVGSSTHTKEQIAAIRKKEAENSAQTIGAEFCWLGFPDEFLFNNAETRLAFINLVRQVRPDLILCPNPTRDYHPDHTTCGQIIWDIHVMVTVPNIVTDHPPCRSIPEIIYMDTIAGVNFIPNRYVDISDDIETKKKMLACHKSQDQWMVDQYGVTCVAMMESFARTRGFQCGCGFAEAFQIPPIWPRKVEANGLIG